jgi:maltooligosyltrehalose trehalohydrolase
VAPRTGRARALPTSVPAAIGAHRGTYAAPASDVSRTRRKLPIGAELGDGGVHFRVWAPAWSAVSLVLESPERAELSLEPESRGYFSRHVRGLGAGARYRFRLGDESRLHADLGSRYQPDGPFGPSQVIDPDDTPWTDAAWQGITHPHEQVIYELHVGTFTPEGTWRAAMAQLPFLGELGITTIEMMPVNDYAGTRGWGYDGVNLFAPCRNYGTPAELRAFVDRAHALGLAVLLDVVYNHFGPAGSSHFAYAPSFKHAAQGPNEWGDALDFGNPGVRAFFASNAAYWIDEFHFDGLRLDATHAIIDQPRDGRPHVIAEITRAARAAAGTRQIFLVAENEPQDTTLITEHGMDALWNDDFEHSARIALTGVTEGYFHDFRGTPQELVSAIQHGFLYQGQLFAWQRNVRGTPTRGLPPARLVHYLENHDQVANLGFGDRLTELVDAAKLRALTAVLLLGPQIPMLFQGQETGSRRTWRYFIDHEPALAALVREGRARFLSQFARLATPEAQAVLPDPSAPETFAGCVLDPAERRLESPNVQLHRDLLELRRAYPGFTDQREGVRAGACLGRSAFCIRWWHETGDRLLLVNLGHTYKDAILPEPLLAPPRETGWRIAWSSEHPRYGGHGTPEPFTLVRLAIPAHAAVLCAPDPAAYLRVVPPPPSGEAAPVDP